MLNYLRGPRPLNGQEISFIKDRFRGDRTYLPFSYFAGATPENNYTPTEPYSLTVTSDSHSFDEDGYARLHIAWCLWEQYLLTDIRQPKSADPWA